jgi:hypothetical protein
MGLLAAMVVAVAYVIFLNGLWDHLPPKQAAALRGWLRDWVIKGLAVPFFIWLIFNAGFSSRFPPLMPRIDMARTGPARLNAFMDVAAMGLFFLTTYWAAISACWLLALLWEGSDRRQEFKEMAQSSSILLGPLAAGIFALGRWSFGGVAVAVWFSPIVRGGFNLLRVNKKPLYSRAIARMHFDKYKEAEEAVIEELEKFEEDYDGWMMLAELYANHFGDLAGAERVVRDTCKNPERTPSQFAAAFHQLADWQLKFASDPVAARAALGEICKRYEGSHLARMAQRRIDSLPASREDLAEQREVKPVHMPALSAFRESEADDSNAPGDASPNAALAQANKLVAKLKLNPDNIAAREELARVFTERLEKADLGIEQIELLLTMESLPKAKAAELLAQLGTWQIKYKGDAAAGKATLERLIANHPESPQAHAARRRISLMEMDEKEKAAKAKIAPQRKIKISI